MKNNFRFILPRLIGATVIVGIAALILATLFKLMIGLLLIGGVVGLIKRAAGGRRGQLNNQPYGNVPIEGFGPYHHSQWAERVSTVVNPAPGATIVPVN